MLEPSKGLLGNNNDVYTVFIHSIIHLNSNQGDYARDVEARPRSEVDLMFRGLVLQDIFLLTWSNRRGTCLEFTCTNPLQAAAVARCVEEGSYAVEQAHLWKLARCKAEDLAFLPFAVDTFRGWHPVALATITKLGRQLARNVGQEAGEQVRHLRQR